MTILTRTVPALPAPGTVLLDEARVAPSTRATHDALAARCAAFEAVELVTPPHPIEPPARLTVAAWNAERLKFHEPSAALVAGTGADLLLLTETDVGMARSGNRHTAADLAAALGMGHAYGVEFVELGLGDAREREQHAHETNAVGFHGNAILSRLPLRDAGVIRLDDGAAWWIEAADGQGRLGWRMAVAARLDTAAGPLVAAAVHLENRSSPEGRAAQVGRLLGAVEAMAGGDPVILGGDFNTSALPAGTTSWLAEPDAHEPLFGLLARAGFDWRACNTDAITQRAHPDGTPEPPLRRIDWLFTRGLGVSAAATVPALDGAGQALSDHDLVQVTLSTG